MPPLSKLRTPALDVLARHLAAAESTVVAADADRAERLAGEVEPERAYPLEWIAFRITGRAAEVHPAEVARALRGEGDGPGSAVKGAALLADLSALVERLTAAVGEPAPAGSMEPAAVAERWQVSRKTLDRWRRQGLVARRVIGERGRSTLVFMRSVVERFEARHREEIASAGSYTRIDSDQMTRIVERGRRYARAGLSLNEAARRLAVRHGRSHETVRQLLRRADAGSARPSFGAPAAPAGERRRIAHRAWRRGIEPALVARRFGRTRASVVRLINDQRAVLLRSVILPEHADAGSMHGERGVRKWLSPAPVRTELGAPGHTDLRDLIDAARRPEVPIGIVESTRACAYHFLLGEAQRLIASIPAMGGHPTEIDRAETMLRWAARLKAELVRSQIGLMLRTIEAQLDAPVDQLRAAEARELVEVGLAAVAHAVDAFDPFKKSGRLAAPTGLAVNRAASRWVRDRRAGLDRGVRATPRLRAGTPIRDWTLGIAPWQGLLEPDQRLRAAARDSGLAALPERERAFLLERFGWGGGPPRTLAEMAGMLKLTPMRSAQRERLAIRAGLEAWRGRCGAPA